MFNIYKISANSHGCDVTGYAKRLNRLEKIKRTNQEIVAIAQKLDASVEANTQHTFFADGDGEYLAVSKVFLKAATGDLISFDTLIRISIDNSGSISKKIRKIAKHAISYICYCTDAIHCFSHNYLMQIANCHLRIFDPVYEGDYEIAESILRYLTEKSTDAPTELQEDANAKLRCIHLLTSLRSNPVTKEEIKHILTDAKLYTFSAAVAVFYLLTTPKVRKKEDSIHSACMLLNAGLKKKDKCMLNVFHYLLDEKILSEDYNFEQFMKKVKVTFDHHELAPMNMAPSYIADSDIAEAILRDMEMM